MKSQPSTPGISRSTVMTSGRMVRAMCTADAASRASSTSYPALLSCDLISTLKSSSSSTTSTRRTARRAEPSLFETTGASDTAPASASVAVGSVNEKRVPWFELAVHENAAAVLFDQRLRDGEAEAGAALAPRRGAVDLLELLEQTIQILGSNAFALIRDGQRHGAVRTGGSDGDVRTRGRELDGVRQQVHQRLDDAIGIDHHRPQPGRQLGVERDLRQAGRAFDDLDRLPDEVGDVDRLCGAA